MRNEPGEKKLRVKEGGAPEHTHRLRNRHGPMVAQRCLGAERNSPRKFALVSCFELPKQTQNELCFGLILFEMTSYQFVLQFRLKNLWLVSTERYGSVQYGTIRDRTP